MLSLLSILDQRAGQNSEKLAYIFLKDRENQEQTITYQQLSQISKRIAARLQSLIPPGARALLLYPQGLEFITAFLGCLSAGIIAVPAYPPKRNQKISRLIAIIKDSQPQIILTTSSLLENIQLKIKDFLELSVTQFLATDNLNNGEDFEFYSPDISGNTLAFLQYTSGSTGSPKGVMISHDNIAHNSVYIQKAFELTEKSVSVTWLPSFHDMGLIDGIIQPG
jgi:acyl-CoA synthetase (AMP-forming)/AMP-acid ligase II